eukprot:COSAG01_NODE_18277_length_1087_cov_1.459514_1_plen_218_part_00
MRRIGAQARKRGPLSESACTFQTHTTKTSDGADDAAAVDSASLGSIDGLTDESAAKLFDATVDSTTGKRRRDDTDNGGRKRQATSNELERQAAPDERLRKKKEEIEEFHEATMKNRSHQEDSFESLDLCVSCSYISPEAYRSVIVLKSPGPRFCSGSHCKTQALIQPQTPPRRQPAGSSKSSSSGLCSACWAASQWGLPVGDFLASPIHFPRYRSPQ